ncbi:MAG: hypothetical protein OEW35_05450 [Gammaproteobacteria bacterium]|nr:hypothetical protein [Gammaproteobacteria bacterium]MDH4253078.1 hypothetical protein [Gammaproteobacteria bacterium]MDH5308904.1 hypothetical protein [Gammaproteobacteria bacterium]
MRFSHFAVRAVGFAALYWLLESALHALVFDGTSFEFWPADPNELSMRLTIVVLIVLFGCYADGRTRALLRKEREKQEVFNATVSSAMHIINNLLNQMQYFKMKAEDSGEFDRATLDLYDRTMDEGQELLARLSSVDELSEDTIRLAVHPDSLKK